MDELMDTIVVANNQSLVISEDTNAPDGVSPAVDVLGNDATLTVNANVSLSAEGVGSTAANVSGNNATIINNGTISSDSRAVDITDGDGSSVTNIGNILGTDNQRNGTLYVDGTVDNLSVTNEGTIDAGVGNNGSGVSVQVGDNIEGTTAETIVIANSGTIQGRGVGNGGVTPAGVRFFAGTAGATLASSSVTNEAGGVIASENNAGILVGPGVNADGLTITNAGTINGGNGFAIDADGALGDLSVTNAGTLNGTVRLGGGNDTFTSTGARADVVNGGAGNDVIAGGGGQDTLDGGDGVDTNSFQGIGAEVVADLASGVAAYQPNPTTTIFERFQNFENLSGSANDDQLFGDNNVNVLSGENGNDLLAGRGGNDILTGGLGNDILRGGGGSDTLDGGAGIDTADFSDINAGVTANLALGTANYAAPNGNNVQDTTINIENIIGSANNDTLTGDANDNEINGGAGADILTGGAGDDILRGDAIGDGEAVVVTVTNTLPAGGTFLTPVWFGFHDGANFDLFNAGEAASLGLERLAEDGSIEGVAAEFNQQVGANGVDATIVGGTGVPGPIDPGESASFAINVNLDQVGRGFFTWATMVIPSNDAFLAVPDNALADPIFDASGNFTPLTIRRFGADVLDAGTEVNNELEAAFLNQTVPNTGTDENGVVGQHPGFNGSVGNPNATPVNILGGTTAPGAVVDPVIGDFTANPNQQLLEITITRLAGGSDVLDGGAGNDVLDGGSGSDTLTGGEGADVFAFSGDPFDGLDVSAPGRQISGDEDFITDFDFANDRYRLDVANFSLLSSTVNFLSLDANVAGSTISDDANVIVLQNANNADPSTPFSAVAAAEQIAALTNESRAGFFVYFNTTLGVNRLVYSTDLSDANADLSIIARQTDLTDNDAIAALSNFTANNFEFDDSNLQNSNLLLPGNNLVQLDLDLDANALQFTIDTLNVTQASELELFRTDVTGAVIGDGPVAEFSLLAANNQLASFSPQFTVDEFLDGEFLRAELVGLDGTRTVSIPTAINDDQVALNFGNNTIVNVEIGTFDVGINTSALEVNAAGDEVINLTGTDGVLTATFSIFREAAFDNTVGFYQTSDANGAVIDPVTGTTLLPGEAGYREAAVANQIDVTLSGQNGQAITSTVTLEAGGFLGTFLIADGTDPLSNDVFFSFGAANGGDDHVRQLGDNTFGFEDLAGLGDADFNDVIVEFSLV